MSFVSGESHQILVWRNVKVLCLTFCGPKTWCGPSLESPNGTRCLHWLFCVFFAFSDYPPQSPGISLLKICDLWQWFLSCFNAHIVFACRFIFGLPWRQIGMSCWHFTFASPDLTDDFTSIPIPDFTVEVPVAGSEEKTWCVSVCAGGNLTDLAHCPCACFGRGGDGWSGRFCVAAVSQPNMARAKAALIWNWRGLFLKATHTNIHILPQLQKQRRAGVCKEGNADIRLKCFRQWWEGSIVDFYFR